MSLDHPPSSGERRNESREERPDRRHRDVVFSLARAAEFHDPDTGRHLLRIRDVVRELAMQLGWEADDAVELGLDAMLHDVGKLLIPPAILRKPGELTSTERKTMEAHTLHGERLLSDLPTLGRAARIARSHHECWNGSGYPDGLSGDDIPIEARITSVADFLDALLSPRAYKPGWSFESTVAEVVAGRGSRLDPDVVDAAAELFRHDDFFELFLSQSA